jgi:hypothetical protein
MAKNEFAVQRTAVFEDVLIGNVATTHYSNIMIPAGAVITGVKACSPTAQTNYTSASATVQLLVGTDSIISTVCIKNLGAVTIPTSLTINQAGGVYVPTTGELNLQVAASANSSFIGTYDFYVDYLYVVE